MSLSQPRILVTGANGQLGRLVVERLIKRIPASQVIAGVRDVDTARDLAALGVEVRTADYDAPASLKAAFAGVDRLLLISSNAMGRRVSQHGHVIDAARQAGVSLIAYTSVLHADTSSLGLAAEHLATEKLLQASGVPFALLRNGWYTENYTGSAHAAVEHGVILGSAGDGRIAAAARADYADAAVAVLLSNDTPGDNIYELAGDTSFTLAELADEIAKQSRRPVTYKDLPEEGFKAALIGMGLPEGLASLLADSSVQASRGALFDDGRALSALIGRPTTTLSDAVAAALATKG
ncbi:NAD(P)H dehydrogenase (quinone) [Rhodanobacter sp. K2T2]|uniref:SDR family oxidoreductase n=1 Tax=Rhodanobacter sp. K2T2 TaxID=2723085 RepID=UPI0015C83767|nr:SDR family oxidoreductase [Rhodanobacter sp. K2T2]NYE27620.1 NAD(P)H dehydrogenase (quinone) [Rhodanobacter sp. K2T2]